MLYNGQSEVVIDSEPEANALALNDGSPLVMSCGFMRVLRKVCGDKRGIVEGGVDNLQNLTWTRTIWKAIADSARPRNGETARNLEKVELAGGPERETEEC